MTPPAHRKALLAFTYFFLIITAYYLIKPVRSALVISHLGSQQLPYLYLLTALVLGGVGAGYARLARRMAPQRLMQGILLALGLQLLVFRWALRLPYAWISGLFYLWVSMFSVVTVTQFWMVADDLFSLGEAKRAFGFIGAGGIVGGIVGGAMVGLLVRWLRSEDLLVISAGLLALCAVLLHLMWTASHRQASGPAEAPTHPGNPSHCASLRCYLRTFRSLRDLLVLVVIAKAVSTIIDYQFNSLAEFSVVGAEARTALFGAFYSGLSVVSLIVQLVLASRLLNRVGVHRTLAVLPVGLAVGLVGLLIIPGLAFAGLVALYDRSLSYSLGQTGKEVLYVPVPSEVRYQVKPLIDAAAFRLAQGTAGVALLAVQRLGDVPPHALSLLALPLIGVWLLAIYRLKTAQPAWVASSGSDRG